MIDFLIKYLLPALVGGAVGYVINQLPALQNFRGSRGLAVAVALELIIGGAILAWAKENSTATGQEWIVALGYVILGAFLVNLGQLVWGVTRSRGSANIATPPSQTAPLPVEPRTVIKGTRMKGNRSIVRVTQKDVRLEDNQVEGDEQQFRVEEPDSTDSSGGTQQP